MTDLLLEQILTEDSHALDRFNLDPKKLINEKEAHSKMHVVDCDCEEDECDHAK